MNLADLKQIPMNRKNRKRIGRGPASGQGKTAGRGENGQKSRSGYSRRMGFEGGQMPLYRRLPKKGFTNYLFRVEYAIVNTGQLNDFEAGTTVDVDMLKGAGLVKQRATLIKILGKGSLTTKLTIRAHAFSASARQQIDASGGTVEEILEK